MLYVHIARLVVLYEDLRIELTAIAEASIPNLDVTDEKYRRHYFLRRSVATLVEFAEGFRLLDQCPDFDAVKNRFDPPASRRWNKALRYFNRNESLLQQVRNDIGGHFGLNAAKYAVENLDSSAVGKIEANFDARDRGGTKLHFAGEIAATAMLHHLSGTTSEVRARNLIRRVVVGYRHAAWSVHLIIAFYLWDRFGHS